MGRRKSRKKPLKRIKRRPTTIFDCPLCSTIGGLDVRIDHNAKTGIVTCSTCDKPWQATIPSYYEKVDLYCKYLDECVNENKRMQIPNESQEIVDFGDDIDTFGDNDNEEENDDEEEFFLIIYSVDAEKITSIPNETNFLNWIQNFGKLCQPSINKDKYKTINSSNSSNPIGITFKRGQLFKFFNCLRKLIAIDLFPLIGCSFEESINETEENLNCGSLENETLSLTILKLNHLIETYESTHSAQSIAKEQFNLDNDWFIKTVETLHASLSIVADANSVAFGILE
eukprot:TRINITY_DN4201_c0_g3_i1.p1 TRINITY_DN4201_c0_g3~~TRINITY_DN4201_c0_g3_i1.p1  ORF type:complete len:285 (+),score=121.59 TRINITY_DN4201_c0_g3_i1:44-898(+)